MNRKWSLSVVTVVGTVLSLAAGFTPEEARRVYGVVSTNAPASVMEAGGFIFMDLKWSVPEGAEPDDRAELEMTALSDALERYVLTPSAPVTNTPFCTALTEWLVPETPYNIPNVSSTVVKLEESTNSCRKVFAFDATGLNAARKESAAIEARRHSRTPADWVKSLDNYYQTLKTEQDRRQFLVLLGCPIVSVVKGRGHGDFGKPVKGAERGLVELDILLKAKEADISFFSTHEGLLWRNFSASGPGMFYPSLKGDDQGSFAEALKLCRSKNWKNDSEKILNLLADSIRANPFDAQKWLYLGGVLLGCGKPLDGLVAYMQSACFDDSKADAWKGIMRCCAAAGMTANAEGLKWYLQIKK